MRLLFIVSLLVGVVSFSGKPSPPQPNRVLYPIFESGKCGYIDETGKAVIEPQFDDAKPFSEGLARVKIGEKWGFIDRAGRIVIQPQFELYSNGRDANNSSLDFHEGMAAVSLKQGGKWGYIDRSGRIVVAPKYDVADRFAEGLARVGNNYSESLGTATILYAGGAASYIDKSGKTIALTVVGGTFSEGLAVASASRKPPSRESDLMEARKDGYIDKTGHFQIEPRLWAIYPFSEGLARVRAYDRNQWGYIDHKGTMIIKMQYEDAGDFKEGLARVKLDERMGFIDKFGRLVVRPAFIAVGNFSGALASACVENVNSLPALKCGYIDKSGGWVIEPTFIFLLGDFKGRLAFACTIEKCGYIDRAGKFVWFPKRNANEESKAISAMTGCSILSDKSYQNYPCTLDISPL